MGAGVEVSTPMAAFLRSEARGGTRGRRSDWPANGRGTASELVLNGDAFGDDGRNPFLDKALMVGMSGITLEGLG